VNQSPWANFSQLAHSLQISISYGINCNYVSRFNLKLEVFSMFGEIRNVKDLLRINQYVKNLFIFFPAFFGGTILDYNILLKNIQIFIGFSLLTSFVYIINDIVDIKEDINHPIKQLRPLPSGKISIHKAIIISILLLLSAFFISYIYINMYTIICFCIYIILNIFYTFFAKKLSILDVICIALGFILRVLAGSFSIEQNISQWLLIMVFILSIFLALGKRWHDVNLIENYSTNGIIRKSLNGYTKNFLISLLTFFATTNTICYIIYAITNHMNSANLDKYFFSTALWVVVGNMRYLQIIFVSKLSYSPTKALFSDKLIRYCVIFWSLHVALFIYL
jgi:4-hydroxybenzoate polyprenyltransferase